MNFKDAVVEILMCEHQRSKADAEMLVKRFPQVMINCIMLGHGRNYRAAAMALEMAEEVGHDAPINLD